MSITVVYRGKNKRFAKRISLRKLVSITVLCSLFILVSSRSTESVNENFVRVNVVKTGLEQQAKEIEQLKLNTMQKVSGVVNKVATMQSQISLLDTISSRLAEQAGLKQEDFTLPKDVKASLLTDSTLVNDELDAMAIALEFKVQQLAALESLLMGLNIDKASNLSGRPIDKGWLSSYYGVRKDPFSGKAAMHKGLDFAGKLGDKVIATAAGVVTWSGDRYGYGKLVEIDHGNGLRTRYGHNHELTVEIGDVVTKGQHVAIMGSTGRSTGPHVHYEVLKHGAQVDPLPYIYH